jgi:hypothetical protein
VTRTVHSLNGCGVQHLFFGTIDISFTNAVGGGVGLEKIMCVCHDVFPQSVNKFQLTGSISH